MEGVLGLDHVKDLVLHVLNVQLGVQPTVYPHLVDLAEEGVHVPLQATIPRLTCRWWSQDRKE